MTSPDSSTVLAQLNSEPVSRLLRRIVGSEPCHLVGGVVRDRLLSRTCHDYDAVVSGQGAAVASRLEELLPARRVDLGGTRFAAYRLVSPALVVDIWDRYPMSVADDLWRRDFTINALGLDLTDGRLEDPCGGLADLRRRTLRATTDRGFSEDPLRVLRLVRFAAQLTGFSVDPATLDMAREAVGGLRSVATERVREELRLTLAAKTLEVAFPLLVETGLHRALWSSGDAIITDPGRTAGALRQVESLAREIGRINDRIGGLDGQIAALEDARWLVLLGDPDSPTETVGPALRRASRRGLLTRRQASRIAGLAGAGELPDDLPGRRRFLHRCGPLWPTALVVQGARQPVASWSTTARQMASLASTVGATVFEPPRLLGGGEICRRLGLEPGPEIGRILDEIEDLQVSGEISTPAEARAWLARRRSGS